MKYWKPYGSYPNADLRALRFHTLEDRNLAVDLCFDDPNLVGIPVVSSDGRTFIIPAGAVQYFKAGGAKFRVYEVMRLSDLSEEEITEMRRKYN